MAWHLAPSLKQLLAEVNAKWPNRRKDSDGTIGDAAHSARTSDHNPNSRGSVNAIDITRAGIDTGTLIAIAKKHPSVRYIIFDRKIMNRDIGNWAARPYSGSNPHTQHVHISIYQSAAAENRTQSWGLANAKAVSGVSGATSTYREVKYGDTLKLYTKGAPVREWQEKALGYTGKAADGFFGSDTERDTRKVQERFGVKVDGVVGPDTWPLRNKVTPPKVKSAPGTAKPFPWPKDHYIGPKSGPNRSHSGYYGNDAKHIKAFVDQLVKRGWNARKGSTYLTRYGNDGRYGTELEALIRAFQRDQGLVIDGLAGKSTWDAAFKNPVT